MPAYMVVPPESTMLAYKSLRMSTSHFMIEVYVVSCTPANPDRVLALGRRDDLHLHRGRSERRDLLGHAVGDAGVHGGATREHNVGVQILADVDVTFHDRVVRSLVHTRALHAEEGGLEEGLRAAEALVAQSDDLAIRQLVRLLPC